MIGLDPAPSKVSGRRTLRLHAAGLVLLVSPWGAGGAAAPVQADPSASEILYRAEQVRSPELDYAVEMELRATDPRTTWKERTAEYTMIAHGKDYSLVMMRKPTAFYPGTLLITEGKYWLLLPRSKRPYQLAPRHILNGDISNGDLARGNLMAFYDVRSDGSEVVRDEPCWRLELTRKHMLGMYSRIRAWVTKEGFRPWKLEYYGETGALLKVAHYEDYRETALGLRSMRIRVENRLRPGEKTVLTFTNLRRIDASGFDFTREGLTAFRDAAQRVFAANGAHASAEDLLPPPGPAAR